MIFIKFLVDPYYKPPAWFMIPTYAHFFNCHQSRCYQQLRNEEEIYRISKSELKCYVRVKVYLVNTKTNHHNLENHS